MRVTRRSRKDDLWEEVERLRRARDEERTQRALLEGEGERLREENERLQERSRFVEELSREARATNEKLEILATLSKEVVSFDLEAVLAVCLRRIPFLAGAQCASLYLHDPDARRLRLARHTHSRELSREVDLDEAPDSLMAVALRERELLCIDDLGQFQVADGRTPQRPFQERYRTASCVVAPLVAGGEVEGVLNLTDRFEDSPFGTRELSVIRYACDLLAVSLRNARLFEQVKRAARTDPLTGLLNRLALTETIEIEVKRARRYRNDLAIVACVIGGLRLVNANYGLGAGDLLIQQVGRLLRANVRDVDLVGRTSGTEFALILPEQTHAGALVVARRLAGVLASERIDVPGGQVAVDACFGIAEYRDEGGGGELYQRSLNAASQARAEGIQVGPLTPESGTTDTVTDSQQQGG